MIAIGVAIGLVALSRAMDIEFYTSRIFPLIPVLYAIVYQTIERVKTGKAKTIPPSRAGEEIKVGAQKLFENVTALRIITAIGISFGIKLVFEILFVILYVRFQQQPFETLYGSLWVDILGRFLRGDHPWLSGSEGFYLLVLLAIITSFGTGLWIGFTSRGSAIIEAVLAGAAVTIVTSMTNMLILYRRIEEVANQMAASMGYATRIGFVVVIGLQVFMYGIWAALAEKAKQDRIERNRLKKSVRRPRK